MGERPRELRVGGAWDGDTYQRRFDELAADGVDVHGEAALVRSFSPATVLDAGCGTGRVAIELARHGITVVGVDREAAMLATASRAAPGIEWVHADLAGLDLGRTFDAVVMAGNVVLFAAPATESAVVEGAARHVAAGGVLIAGFSLGRGYPLDAYDSAASAAGLEPAELWSTWERATFEAGSGYAVSVHRRPARAG